MPTGMDAKVPKHPKCLLGIMPRTDSAEIQTETCRLLVPVDKGTLLELAEKVVVRCPVGVGGLVLVKVICVFEAGGGEERLWGEKTV